MKLFYGLTATLIFALSLRADAPFTGYDVDSLNRYQATCTFTTAAAATDCAITVPATGTKRVFLESIVVRSPEAATVTFGYGGSAASTNAVTTVKRNTTVASQATVYGATSGAGAPTSTTDFKVQADQDTAFDMTGRVFPIRTSTTVKVSISSTTGSGKIDFFWGESK